MRYPSIRRTLVGVFTSAAVAGGILLAASGTAQAASAPDPNTPGHSTPLGRSGAVSTTANAANDHSASRAATLQSTGPAYLPYYGSNADFPTWFWGATELCAANPSGRYGLMQVQSRTGAAPEYVSVPPSSTRCIDRWWWGVPVNAMNVGDSPLWVTSY